MRASVSAVRATGDLLDDYEPGAGGRPSPALMPGDAASHQFGARMRFSPTADQELLIGGFYDEQTGVDYPGRLLTAEHFLLRSWQASYRVANPEGPVSSVALRAYVNKKSHRMSNRGKPTAADMPGRKPPFALDVSLPAESDTVGGPGGSSSRRPGSGRCRPGSISSDWSRMPNGSSRAPAIASSFSVTLSGAGTLAGRSRNLFSRRAQFRPRRDSRGCAAGLRHQRRRTAQRVLSRQRRHGGRAQRDQRELQPGRPL